MLSYLMLGVGCCVWCFLLGWGIRTQSAVSTAVQGRQGELSGYTASTCQGKGGLSLSLIPFFPFFLSHPFFPSLSRPPRRSPLLHPINTHIPSLGHISFISLHPQDMQSRSVCTIASIIESMVSPHYGDPHKCFMLTMQMMAGNSGRKKTNKQRSCSPFMAMRYQCQGHRRQQGGFDVKFIS